MKFISKGKFSKVRYLDEPCIIDTETSWNHNEEDPICWITSIQIYFNGKTYLMRKPSELISWLRKQISIYDLGKFRRMLIVIHNQSYDLSYLLPYIQEHLPGKDEHRAVLLDEHKIVNYFQAGLDFRCSFLLTRKSLEKLGEEFNVEHKKQIGLYNYDLIHYQDDFLSMDERKYATYDVVSLYECFMAQLRAHGDTTATVPLTATGYTRRKLRSSSRGDKYYRNKYFRNNALDCESYKFSINAYSGGYTHNNRFLRNKIIKASDFGMESIRHGDFRSFFPSQMRCYPLPTGKPDVWYDYKRNDPDITIKDILDLYPRFATVSMIAINKAQLKDPDGCTMPIMQSSKLFYDDGTRGYFAIYNDNGRVLKIECENDSTYVYTYVWNHTLKIISEQYDIQGVILKVIRFSTSELPSCLADVVDELFRAKSDLKAKAHEAEAEYGAFSPEAFDARNELMISKGLLNSIYGCCCMNPVRPSFDIDCDRLEPIYISKNVLDDDQIEEALKDYYNTKNNFLPYQLGCYITEIAKMELFQFIKAIGYQNVIYCDTDSIFYLSNKKIDVAVEALNKRHSKTAPYVIDGKGKKIQYDVFEMEPDVIAFKGLHSKCYGVIELNSKGEEELHLTIAGVPAKTLIGMKKGKPIYLTREEELSGITPERKLRAPGTKIRNIWKTLEKLDDQAAFCTNTGTTCHYIMHKPEIIQIDGHEIETAGGAIIKKLDQKTVKNMDIDENIEYEILEGELL